MYVCVCMYVCMYVRIYVCMYVCMCVCVCIYVCMYILGLKRIVYFDIRIFFNFQTNSPNILLHIKVVNDTTFSQFMTPISLIVPIMKANYSEILTLNIDYYV